jgi:hypothetical protein
VVINGATTTAATVTVYVFETVPALLVAVTVNVAGPAAVGVPDTIPVTASSTSPAGNAPEVTANVAAVPDAATGELYAAPTVPSGSEPVVINGATTAERTDTE